MESAYWSLESSKYNSASRITILQLARHYNSRAEMSEQKWAGLVCSAACVGELVQYLGII